MALSDQEAIQAAKELLARHSITTESNEALRQRLAKAEKHEVPEPATRVAQPVQVQAVVEVHKPVRVKKPLSQADWNLRAIGIIAVVALIGFSIWAVQTTTKVITYKNQNTTRLDDNLRRGWEIDDISTERQAGKYDGGFGFGSTRIGAKYSGDSTVTTVTLKRSNWSKMWD